MAPMTSLRGCDRRSCYGVAAAVRAQRIRPNGSHQIRSLNTLVVTVPHGNSPRAGRPDATDGTEHLAEETDEDDGPMAGWVAAAIR